MSGSTGTPMNLNTFDGTDDVVKALTDIFNQNMNLINSGDIHTKVWKPNTAYQKNDILVHPYHSSLMYALSSHTSSNSTTEADWSTNDGAKWRNLSYAPVIANWMANMNYNVGDLLMDGLELKQATTAGSTATLDRTRSAFVGSRVANWTPNTKYNVGDLVLLSSLNADDVTKGTIKNGIMVALQAHTSGTSFPGYSDGLWALTNKETFVRSSGIIFGYGRYLSIYRVGNTETLGYMATGGGTGTINAGQEVKLVEKLPDWADLSLNGGDQTVYFNNTAFTATDGIWWQLTIHGNAANANRLMATKRIAPGDVLRGQGTIVTDSPIMWESGIPAQ